GGGGGGEGGGGRGGGGGGGRREVPGGARRVRKVDPRLFRGVRGSERAGLRTVRERGQLRGAGGGRRSLPGGPAGLPAADTGLRGGCPANAGRTARGLTWPCHVAGRHR